MEAVNWGIISASGFALERSGPAFVKGKNVYVTAVGSRDLGKAQAFAKALGIPKAYGSYEEVLDDPDIEVSPDPAQSASPPITSRSSSALRWKIGRSVRRQRTRPSRPISTSARLVMPNRPEAP